ncbi:MAG TPA: MgtC/SapB family protein [Candidatus Angelobacter sp.]|jgi:putative Mg2+ transporter-C (MgtC) family protein|nr:MgtC/SapB family protein [Candidatus Angelobacter sp.]
MFHDLSVYMVGRLLLAALLGGAVGLERELRHKPAGLRTMMLIAIGSALYSIISYEAAGAFGGDHTRISAQIIPGIGFIGAGVVIRDRGSVTGITSAATIFVIASVGMAVGSGLPVTAIFTTLLLLTALVILGLFEDRVGIHTRLMTFCVTTAQGTAVVDQVHKLVQDAGVQTQRWRTRREPGGLQVEFDAELTTPQERALLSKFEGLHLHCEARPAIA